MALELAAPKIFESHQLSNEDYHNTPGLSASQLKHLRADCTPLDFWRQSWMNPLRSFPETKALKFGQAAHMLLLEGEKVFNENWTIKMGVKETTVAGMLAEGEHTMLLRIRDTLLGNPLYEKIIQGCRSEVSIIAEMECMVDFQAPKNDGFEKVPARTRIDLLKPGFCLDLKFMSEVTKESVGYSITDYGYDRQAEWNNRILKLAYPEVTHNNFISMFVEKHETHPKVLAVTYPDSLLKEVRSRNDNAIERYAKMQRKYGVTPEKPWPGFDHRIYNIYQNGEGDADGINLPVRWDYIG